MIDTKHFFNSLAISLIACLTNIGITFADDTDAIDQRFYDIEVIIFEDAHARYLDSEQWHDDTLIPSNEIDSDTSNTPESKTSLFENVTKDSNKHRFNSIKPQILTPQYNSLKRSSEFNVLFRSAWRQVGSPANEAFEIDLDDLVNTHAKRTKNTISGSLKIVLARYLHFYSKLEYTRLNEPEKSNITSTEDKSTSDNEVMTESGTDDTTNTLIKSDKSYPIHSHRRMRSKELHYIDHPLVGILVQINPVEVKPEDDKLENIQSQGINPESIKNSVQTPLVWVNAAQSPNVFPTNH